MKIEDLIKNNILINKFPSNLNLAILIELIKESELNNKNELLEKWESIKSLELKKYKDYDLKNKIDLFRIELIESLVFAHRKIK